MMLFYAVFRRLCTYALDALILVCFVALVIILVISWKIYRFYKS